MPNDRHSSSGYAFKLCNESSLISWKSKKQTIVALSTCEAEYVALATATQEAKFLRQLSSDLICLPCKSVCMYVDNQGAIALANNPIHHQRSKHIDVKHHYLFFSQASERAGILNPRILLANHTYVTGSAFYDTAHGPDFFPVA